MSARRRSGFPVAVIAVSLLTACSSATLPPNAAALPAERDIETTGGLQITATPSPDWALVSAGQLWVAGVRPGLARCDAATRPRHGGLSIEGACLRTEIGLWPP